jgi:hypothetical protein
MIQQAALVRAAVGSDQWTVDRGSGVGEGR